MSYIEEVVEQGEPRVIPLIASYVPRIPLCQEQTSDLLPVNSHQMILGTSAVRSQRT